MRRVVPRRWRRLGHETAGTFAPQAGSSIFRMLTTAPTLRPRLWPASPPASPIGQPVRWRAGRVPARASTSSSIALPLAIRSASREASAMMVSAGLAAPWPEDEQRGQADDQDMSPAQELEHAHPLVRSRLQNVAEARGVPRRHAQQSPAGDGRRPSLEVTGEPQQQGAGRHRQAHLPLPVAAPEGKDGDGSPQQASGLLSATRARGVAPTGRHRRVRDSARTGRRGRLRRHRGRPTPRSGRDRAACPTNAPAPPRAVEGRGARAGLTEASCSPGAARGGCPDGRSDA